MSEHGAVKAIAEAIANQGLLTDDHFKNNGEFKQHKLDWLSRTIRAELEKAGHVWNARVPRGGTHIKEVERSAWCAVGEDVKKVLVIPWENNDDRE